MVGAGERVPKSSWSPWQAVNSCRSLCSMKLSSYAGLAVHQPSSDIKASMGKALALCALLPGPIVFWLTPRCDAAHAGVTVSTLFSAVPLISGTTEQSFFCRDCVAERGSDSGWPLKTNKLLIYKEAKLQKRIAVSTHVIHAKFSRSSSHLGSQRALES